MRFFHWAMRTLGFWCDHPPAAQIRVPDSGQAKYRYCLRCKRHWTWQGENKIDGAWIEDKGE